jgi:hypothetical protein
MQGKTGEIWLCIVPAVPPPYGLVDAGELTRGVEVAVQLAL